MCRSWNWHQIEWYVFTWCCPKQAGMAARTAHYFAILKDSHETPTNFGSLLVRVREPFSTCTQKYQIKRCEMRGGRTFAVHVCMNREDCMSWGPIPSYGGLSWDQSTAPPHLASAFENKTNKSTQLPLDRDGPCLFKCNEDFTVSPKTAQPVPAIRSSPNSSSSRRVGYLLGCEGGE